MPFRNLPIKTGHLFLGLAAIMFFVTVSIFSGKKAEAPHKVEMVPTIKVVVPLVPISEGKTLSYNDVTAVKWPKEYLPKHSTFGEVSDVVGRVAKQDLFPGEPIFTEKLSGSDTKGGLPAVIPQGLRAVSVAVTEVKGVAGFVKPGDRVDVLSTFEVDKEGTSDKLRTTRTVLQNVLVLASAQTMVDDNKYSMETPEGVTRGEATVSASPEEEPKKDKKRKKDDDAEKEAKMREKEKDEAEKAARLVSTVTLALTPEQTETLALAEETGELRLALRPETDHGVNNVQGVNFDELLGSHGGGNSGGHAMGHFPAPPPMPAGPAAPAPPPFVPGRQVEFIQGTDRTLLDL
jgi:pilus assembly protein CpaB